jgi:hypothetical protein
VSGPIKDALSTLSRHADLVADAIKAPLDPKEVTAFKAIKDLRQATALRPTSEDTYRLHPRLREYLFDHLQHFPAYQSLSEIGSHITTMNALWSQIDEVRRIPDDGQSSMDLRDRLQDTIYDIADNMRRNLVQLQGLLSTRYGNVRSLEAKKSQNRWYQRQSNQLIHQLGLLSNASSRIEKEADSFKMHEFAQFIRRNLQSQLLEWKQTTNEMQALLSKEIYQTRQIEMHHRQLSRMDMLLRQQHSWGGVDTDVDGEIPDFLLAARLPAIRAHVEPDDVDESINKLLTDTASSLPPLKKYTPPEPEVRHKRKTVTTPPKPLTPEILAAERLRAHVAQSTEAVSLADWRKQDEEAQTMPPHVWLCFSMLYLRGLDIKVHLIRDAALPGERWSHTFQDAIAIGPKRLQAQAA